jgi:hypothetical protein
MAFVLISCSKHAESPAYNTTIQYTFISTGTTSYNVTYSGTNGDLIDTTVVASSWSKTIHTDSTKWATKNNGKAISNLHNSQSVSPAIKGKINLFINNKLRNPETIKVLNADGYYQIGAIVLKQH